MKNTKSLSMSGTFTEAQARAAAEKDVQAKLRSGKALVVVGFALSIMGIIIYCVSSFSVIGTPDAPLFSGNLSVLGAGVLMWIVGVFRYLGAAIDSNVPDDDTF